jgi:hypothetical protein
MRPKFISILLIRVIWLLFKDISIFLRKLRFILADAVQYKVYSLNSL